jgi:SAM-dependent methyltransferase
MARVLTGAWKRMPSALRSPLQRILLRSPAARKLVWDEKGVEHELEFWERWFSSGGHLWRDDYEQRLDPNAVLQERLIVDRLPEVAADPVSILDVGAGPLTFLGKRYPGRLIQITPVDALADRYDELLARFGIEPPVRTLLCPGEKLLERFDPEIFDVAYARNSLDHSYDPLAIIRNMISVVKTGGFVVTRHVRAEGEHQRYSGFHQWNFDIEGGHLVLWNKAAKHDVTEAVRPVADGEAFRDDEGGGDWVVCVIRKAAT